MFQLFDLPHLQPQPRGQLFAIYSGDTLERDALPVTFWFVRILVGQTFPSAGIRSNLVNYPIAARLPARTRTSTNGALMSFAEISHGVVSFIQQHQAWAPLIVGGLAFAESVAILSFVVPATGILLAIGAVLAAAGIPFWPVWAGAVVGAVLGDWISYVVGYLLKDRIHSYWPFVRFPHFMARAEEFTKKWGVGAVFIGRFSGPLRAFVPLAAGMFQMRRLYFQAANISSAIIWSFAMLLPGEAIYLFWILH